MKILMLGWELPPHNSGGLGVACLHLCQALAKSGADIDFILPYSSKDHDYDFMKVSSAYPHSVSKVDGQGFGAYDSFQYVLEGGRVVYLGGHDQQAAYVEAVDSIAAGREFDIIHAHDWLTFRAALRVKEASGKPLIVHVHSIERDRAGGQPGSPLVREIEASTMHLADRVITVSQRTAQMIANEYSVPLEKIEVIHNSIDQDSFEQLDSSNAYHYLSLMKNQGWRIVVNVGRLTIQKGLSHLIRAGAEVVKQAPKTIFLFVGSGEQRDELLEQAAELGIADRVLFAGFQRGKNWRDAYAVADLFVMPSVSEPFGLTPLEAIGYGAPVLISRQSGVSEVLQNCLKANFWDEHEMANQIASVVANDGLRDALHASAYREYERMSWGGAADKLMQLYQAHHEKAVA